MGQRVRAAALVWILCVSGGATTGPSTGPDPNASAVSDFNSAIARWQNLPLLEKRSISQVVQFSELDGLLIADWPILRSGALNGRIPLTDLPGAAIIETGVGRQTGSIYPMFEYYELIDSGTACRHLQVLSMPTRLQVVRDTEGADGFETVSVLEILDRSDAEPVTLRVQKIEDGRQKVSVVVTAATMADLRREHPMEFESYLRPLFNAFHQAQPIFAVEDTMAWQVMADAWKPPAGLRQRLVPLIAQLNADSYSAREQAQSALRQIGEPAALYLSVQDRRGWTDEQKARVDKLLSEFFPLSPDQARTSGRDVNFLLDCLASDDADLRAATLQRLSKVVGRNINLDLDQPVAQRLDAIARLRRELDTSH
jgi:hypothetical protein